MCALEQLIVVRLVKGARMFITIPPEARPHICFCLASSNFLSYFHPEIRCVFLISPYVLHATPIPHVLFVLS